jgi:hypothetical protein
MAASSRSHRHQAAFKTVKRDAQIAHAIWVCVKGTAIEVTRHKGFAELKHKMAELSETHGFSVGELFGSKSAAKNRQEPQNTRTQMIGPTPGPAVAVSLIGSLPIEEGR